VLIVLRLAVFLGLLVGTGLFGQAAFGQSLDDALAAAYLGNPTLQRDRANLRARDESVPQALSGWRPNATTFGEIGRRHIQGNNAGAPGRNRNLTPQRLGASITQPLFRGGRTLAQTRSAENTVRSARAQLHSSEQRVLFDAAASFLDVYRDQAVLELQIQNEQRLARQLEAARDRFEVGEVTRTDVFQAEARLADATAGRVAAEGDLESSRARYRNVIGEMPGNLKRPEVPRDIPADLEEITNAALDGDPDLLAAEYAERAALDDIDDTRGELLPEINLIGRATQNREVARNNGRTETLEAIVRMDMPLYQSGAVYSRLRQDKQVAAAARRDIDRVRRIAIQRATQAWTDFETAQAQIRSFTKSVEANTVALEGVQQEALVGARTVLDVLDAENELLNSQVGLVTAQRDEGVAVFEVLVAIGELTAQRLELPVDYYDPEKHYREVRGKWFGGSSLGDVNDDSASGKGGD
jgi:outer membrane protein